ncbi:hypothetical protein F5Y16DRAFT_394085 [Xylariaceae sp. FL0255]|nr:hypothetical protein F5Y16DRAFT_394085 [Xylariaceae sp. FL0255]
MSRQLQAWDAQWASASSRRGDSTSIAGLPFTTTAFSSTAKQERHRVPDSGVAKSRPAIAKQDGENSSDANPTLSSGDTPLNSLHIETPKIDNSKQPQLEVKENVKEDQTKLHRLPYRPHISHASTVERDLQAKNTGNFQGTSGSGSSMAADDVLSRQEERIMERVMVRVTQSLTSRFTEACRTVANEANPDPNGENSSSTTAPQTQFSQNLSTSLGKRKVGANSEEMDGDGDEDIPGSHGRKTADEKGKAKRFAYPYFKRCPAKYQSWSTCPGPGWEEVHRVKEHLYRKHRQARDLCNRCEESFKNEQEFVDHQRAPEPCQLGSKGPAEGFNTYQERQLKSRKKKDGIMTEVEQWISIFKILFPDVLPDKIPSPFYEYEDLSRVKARVDESLIECERFILREIWPRLEESLAQPRHVDRLIVEQNLQRQTIDSVNSILRSLFQEFRKRRLRGAGFSIVATSKPSSSQSAAGPSNMQGELSWLELFDPESLVSDLPFNYFNEESRSFLENSQLADSQQPSFRYSTHPQSDSGYGSNTLDHKNGGDAE